MIVKDIAESNSVRRGADGYKAERIFIVKDVTGPADARLYNALNTPGIPQYGEPHPVIPDIEVIEVQAMPVSKTNATATIKVSYGIPSADDTTAADPTTTTGNISLTTTLVTGTEFRDINGDLLQASYVGTSETGFTISTQYGSADVQKPQLTVSFERNEIVIPKATIQDYLGTTNSTAWSGFPAKTWLCSGISAREDKGEFKVTYTFIYNQDTWMLEILAVISEADAEINPIAVETGNGYAIYDVYKLRDFNALGLSF